MAKRGTKLERAFLKAHKVEALSEQKFVCKYCLEPLTPKTSTVEHLKAKSKGGLDHKENIAASCKHCNSIKGNLNIKNFVYNIEHSNDFEYLKIRFRKRLWKRTHLACKRIIQSVGVKYEGP